MLRHFLAELSRGRAFGHPVHLMLIHFPSALLPMSVIFDLIALFSPKTSLPDAAFYCLAAGSLAGFGAAIFGAIDYNRLPSEHEAWKTASLHGLLNLIWLMIFAVLAGVRLQQYPDFKPATLTYLIFAGLSVTGLLYSNYLGGELVLRHKLGRIIEKREKQN